MQSANDPQPGTAQPDPRLLAIAEVFHLYDPPLWLVTAAHGGTRGGLIATCAMRASIVAELPRMLLGIARQHRTWELIEGSGRFALHLLTADDLDAVWRFALRSGHRHDKHAQLAGDTTPDGNPLYPGGASWLDCRVEARMDTGDRSVYLAGVSGGGALRRGPVLTVATLLRDAPAERRAELDRLYVADQMVDAAAIRAWRGTKGID